MRFNSHFFTFSGEEALLRKRFAELVNATSAHTDLISRAEDEAMDEYYEKMEKKEKMEEKMLSTYKVDCKAYRCLKVRFVWKTKNLKSLHNIEINFLVIRFGQVISCVSPIDQPKEHTVSYSFKETNFKINT